MLLRLLLIALILLPSSAGAEQINIDVDIDIAYFYTLREQLKDDLEKVEYIINRYEKAKEVLNAEEIENPMVGQQTEEKENQSQQEE